MSKLLWSYDLAFLPTSIRFRPDQASLLNKYECILESGMGIVVPMIAQPLGQVRTWDELEVDITCLIYNWSHLEKIGKSRDDYRKNSIS